MGATNESAAVVRSNKPMVPTAPASPTANPSHPLRRHIGQPLGCERQVASNATARFGPRTTSDDWRSTGGGRCGR